jgi:hypothetical protein
MSFWKNVHVRLRTHQDENVAQTSCLPAGWKPNVTNSTFGLGVLTAILLGFSCIFQHFNIDIGLPVCYIVFVLINNINKICQPGRVRNDETPSKCQGHSS